MKLSTKSEYTLLALMYLARQGDSYVRMAEICDYYDISKKYLELLFGVLRQNRYIKTKRGAEGGYALARPADKISLAEIIRLMDGALAPTDSVSTYFYADTPISREEKLIDLFGEIRDYIAIKMENVYLADIV